MSYSNRDALNQNVSTQEVTEKIAEISASLAFLVLPIAVQIHFRTYNYITDALLDNGGEGGSVKTQLS